MRYGHSKIDLEIRARLSAAHNTKWWGLTVLSLLSAAGEAYAQSGTAIPLASSPVEFVIEIFNFALAIGGLLAFGMIVIGGVRYITAGGNAGRQSDARDQILQALIGFILLVGSWILLYTINPEIVDFTRFQNITNQLIPPKTATALTPEKSHILPAGRAWGYIETNGSGPSVTFRIVCFGGPNWEKAWTVCNAAAVGFGAGKSCADYPVERPAFFSLKALLPDTGTCTVLTPMN